MPGKGTTDYILSMRQVQENHQAMKKNMYYGFVDLEKAFNRFPREVGRWVLMMLAMGQSLILTVMELYTEACTICGTGAGLSEAWFTSGSILDPLLLMSS